MLSGLDLTITNEWVAEEHFMYGSSRLGVYRSNKTLSRETFEVAAVDGYGNITEKNRLDSFVYVLRTDSFTRVLTQKNYELTNHLGNVLAVVSDRRTPTSAGGINIDYYEADVTNATLYYPFGMELKTYQADSAGYRYGFNGQENENDISGQSGGHVIFEYRIHDARLGRWLSRDPHEYKYPYTSSYCAFLNNPLFFIDPDGRDIVPTTEFKASRYGVVFDKMVTNNNIQFMVLVTHFNQKSETLNLEYAVIAKTSSSKFINGNSQTYGEGRVSNGNNIHVTTAAFNPKVITDNFSSIPNSGHAYLYRINVKFIEDAQDPFLPFFKSQYANAYYTYEYNDLALAIVLYHEMLHTYMHTQEISNENSGHHNKMARGNYIENMKSMIKQFSENNQLGYTEGQIEDLAYWSLSQTGAGGFNEYMIKKAGIPSDYLDSEKYTKEQIDAYTATLAESKKKYIESIPELLTDKVYYSGEKDNKKLAAGTPAPVKK